LDRALIRASVNRVVQQIRVQLLALVSLIICEKKVSKKRSINFTNSEYKYKSYSMRPEKGTTSGIKFVKNDEHFIEVVLRSK